MSTKVNRRKALEGLIPEGVLFSRSWLKQETGFSDHAIDNLVKSEQVKSISKGLYRRGAVRPNWESVVYTLQEILESDLVVGGLSALELKGFSHYLPQGKNVVIHLYGNDNLPAWTKEIVQDVVFVKETRKSLFGEIKKDWSERFTTGVHWKDGMEEIKISTPERACLELIDQVPNKISFEHADQLIQGMTNLSPRALQELLENCTNIKVKRLFLWFAQRHNYRWFKKLNLDKIDLGTGNRSVVKGGELDKDYLITVPKNFER